MTKLRSLSGLFKAAMKLAAAGAFATAIATGASAQTNTFPENGNAGIGTTTPSYPLTVNQTGNSVNRLVSLANDSSGSSAQSTISFFEGATEKFKFGMNSSGATGYVGGANAFQLWHFQNAPIVFGTNSVERMRIDGGGNVGIGTASPGVYKLFVEGYILSRGTIPALSLYTDATQNSEDGYSIISGTDNVLRIREVTAGVSETRMVIDSSGKVGIGTATPAQKFHVLESGNNAFAAQLEQTNTTASNGLYIKTQTTNAGDAALHILSNNGATQLMSVRNNGYVGIGTGTPAYKLDVAGEIRSSAGGFRFPDGSLQTTAASGGGGSSQWSGTAGNPIYYNTGDVGIGTTNPTGSLEVQGAGQNNTVRVISTNAVSGGLYLQNTQTTGQAALYTDNNRGSYAAYGGMLTGGSANAIGNLFGLSRADQTFVFADGSSSQGLAVGTLTGRPLILGTSNAERVRIDSSGNVGIGNTSPGSLLDLKGSNVPYVGQLRIAANDYGQITFFDSANLTPNGTNRKSWIYQDIAAGTFNVGSNGNILLSPNNYVGVGTTTPSYRLDVQGGLINSSGGLCIAGDCKTAWSQVTGSGSQWTTAGSNIYYTGGVGIGTQSPGFPLDVQANAQWAARFRKTDATHGGILIDSAAGYNPNVALAVNGAVKWYMNSNVAQSDSLQFWESTGQTPRLTLTQAGNVGIGTPSPQEKLHVAGSIKVDGNINAKYQDVAEWVPSSEHLSAGTVVVLDTTKSNQVISSTASYDTRVAGVISAQPGITLGESGEGKVLVATTGRVRVKVDASSGPIQIGDLLVTSDVSGVAMKSEPVEFAGRKMHMPGTIIGKALEPLAKGKGEILVLLSLQ